MRLCIYGSVLLLIICIILGVYTARSGSDNENGCQQHCNGVGTELPAWTVQWSEGDLRKHSTRDGFCSDTHTEPWYRRSRGLALTSYNGIDWAVDIVKLFSLHSTAVSSCSHFFSSSLALVEFWWCSHLGPSAAVDISILVTTKLLISCRVCHKWMIIVSVIWICCLLSCYWPKRECNQWGSVQCNPLCLSLAEVSCKRDPSAIIALRCLCLV